jgi:NADPH-dependent glutamate synthase beta subunit-like oxidoreductase
MVLYRRSLDDMPAIANEIDEAIEEGVEFKFFAAPIEIQENGGVLSSVRCIEMRPGEPDESGRRRPEPIAGSEFTLEADTLITAVGESVTFPFLELSNKAGKAPMEIDAWGGTSEDKVFVCGDAGPNTRTVAHAIGSGKHTAMRIDAFLGGNELAMASGKPISMSRYRGNHQGELTVTKPEDINLDYFTESHALNTEKSAVPERLNGFEEVHATLGADAVSEEAARCFSCGFCNKCGTCFVFCPDISIVLSHSETLPDFIGEYCKGCGICARECPRAIIEMVEEQK